MGCAACDFALNFTACGGIVYIMKNPSTKSAYMRDKANQYEIFRHNAHISGQYQGSCRLKSCVFVAKCFHNSKFRHNDFSAEARVQRGLHHIMLSGGPRTARASLYYNSTLCL